MDDNQHHQAALLQNAQNAKVKHKFQRGKLYRKIEDFNKKAKHGQTACEKLVTYASNLPNWCEGPCSAFSLCLSFIVGLLYLGGIIWLCFYNIYELEYYDENDNYQMDTIILDCSESSCLSNEYVVEFYGFQSYVINETNITNITNTGNTSSIIPFVTEEEYMASLIQYDLSSEIFIKIQYFIVFVMWSRLRWDMQEIDISCMVWSILVIGCNSISYMFRHLGWIYYSHNCKVMYSPYFSDEFIHAIISFMISFFCWILLVGICLKKEKIHGQYGKSKLVLRWKGDIIDKNKEIVDNWSVIANVAIFLTFAYTAVGSSLWLGIDNMIQNSKKYIANDAYNSYRYHYTVWMGLIEWLLTTIVQYFVPEIEWISIYLFASVATNLLFVVDVYIFILKFIRDLDAKFQEKMYERKKGEKKEKQPFQSDLELVFE